LWIKFTHIALMEQGDLVDVDWYWRDEEEILIPFNKKTRIKIEKSYHRKDPFVKIKMDRRNYSIDFSNMTLIRKSKKWDVIREDPREEEKNTNKDQEESESFQSMEAMDVDDIFDTPEITVKDTRYEQDEQNNQDVSDIILDDRGFDYLGDDRIEECARVTRWIEYKKDDIKESLNCSICLCELDDEIVLLGQCDNHYFHKNCIAYCLKNKFLTCPICSVIYGTRVGTQPHGTMTVTKLGKGTLAGYPNCGAISISYHFPGGTQGPEHPNPNRRYTGTSRVAYLPDNEEGRKVLKLLQISFDRRLTFTIGTSVTTGHSDTVIWNGIHHKTNTHGGFSSYGYPDDTYLNRVQLELSAVGVTEDDL